MTRCARRSNAQGVIPVGAEPDELQSWRGTPWSGEALLFIRFAEQVRFDGIETKTLVLVPDSETLVQLAAGVDVAIRHVVCSSA